MDDQMDLLSSEQAADPADKLLFRLCLSLFFIWGFATVLIDILVPKLKALFILSFAEVMLTQFAFFIGYLVFSLPAGAIVRRFGYMRGIIAGLGIMALGCLLFIPATRFGVFGGFLLALFVMASGVTTLQVAANAVITLAGPQGTSSARLTLAQAFNSLGTTLGPLIGARLILSDDLVAIDPERLSAPALAAQRAVEANAVALPFIGIAIALVLLMAVFWMRRDMLTAAAPDRSHGLVNASLLRRPRLVFGVLAIFAYVGAEVSIGSLLANYLMQPSLLATTALQAGQLVSLYWGGAMIGRFLGAWVLGHIRPGLVLAVHALSAILLASLSASSSGWMAAAAILAVGLANSIMFPTIFSLALRDLGEDTPGGSALLCLGIVGGAIVPLASGFVADHFGMAVALAVPILCYAWVAFYGLFCLRLTNATSLPPVAGH
ncbi:sugar MFS transporter [Sphingomonas sp. KC8]|uniref:sugar MFS transporter n=1 Tax=Sphingomonas sp. KC8 TaxID=1030157 RepID=UPI0003105C82|nr:sugar MFS transporter [Sphingomonas sp. KC8]